MTPDAQDSQKTSQIQFVPLPRIDWLRAGLSLVSDGVMSWGADDHNTVVENRLGYFRRMALDPATAVGPEQVHATGMYRVRSGDAGRGFLHTPARFAETDGLVTDVQRITLTTVHADCAPIYYADDEHRAIALAHAGRKGILAGLPGKMLNELTREFGSRPDRVAVSIGPMICTEHYDVSPEMARDFQHEFGPAVVHMRGGKPHLDLYAAIAADLLRNGLSAERIPARPPCTSENADYASYRRDGPPARSMMAWIVITSK